MKENLQIFVGWGWLIIESVLLVVLIFVFIAFLIGFVIENAAARKNAKEWEAKKDRE